MAARGWRVLAACRKKSDCARLEDEGLERPRAGLRGPGGDPGSRPRGTCTNGRQARRRLQHGAYAVPACLRIFQPDALRANFEAKLLRTARVDEMPAAHLPATGTRQNPHELVGARLLCASLARLLQFDQVRGRGLGRYAAAGNVRGTGIRVILIEPGPITSSIRQNSIPHYERWIDVPSSARADEYRKRLEPRLYADSPEPDPFELPASAVTRRVAHALTAPEPSPEIPRYVPDEIHLPCKEVHDDAHAGPIPAAWLNGSFRRARTGQRR